MGQPVVNEGQPRSVLRTLRRIAATRSRWSATCATGRILCMEHAKKRAARWCIGCSSAVLSTYSREERVGVQSSSTCTAQSERLICHGERPASTSLAAFTSQLSVVHKRLTRLGALPKSLSCKKRSVLPCLARDYTYSLRLPVS
jgi:hypothetical protein